MTPFRTALAASSLAALALSACASDPSSTLGSSGGGTGSPDAGSTGTDAEGTTNGPDGSTAIPDGGTPLRDATTGGPDASSDTGASPQPDAGPGGDPLLASVVTMGCNRLQKADWDSTANPSSANTAQLTQDFTDIAALPVAPHLFFMTGDLVLGLNATIATLDGQLTGWASLWSGGPLASKVPLVPLPGNHEMLVKVSGNEVNNEASGSDADGEWVSWLHTSGFDSRAGNGPTTAAPNADLLQDDQSKLSYSFDDGGVHYVALNTDTWNTNGSGSDIGWVPLQWLTADLAKAQGNPAITAILVFGHKPIVSPVGSTAMADIIHPMLTSGLESLLDSTAKVKGYFCAHYHGWDARKLPGARGVYQIIAGNAGSQLETTWTPPMTYYGFTAINVYTSGKVGIVSYERPVPSPYNATTGVVAATAQPEIIIAP
jgi:hypothetical protein